MQCVFLKTPFMYKFVHPGARDFKVELDFVREKARTDAQPWKTEFERMRCSHLSVREPNRLFF